MKRIFIAVKIESGENLWKMIFTFQKGLKNEHIKWTDLQNLHITLAFLGDTEEDKVKAIIIMLKGICEGFDEFEMEIRGTGVFKSFRDPRIIWAGIEHSDKLFELNQIIKSGLKEVGVSIEDRPYNPHLTIGRIKNLTDIGALKPLIDKYQNSEIQKVQVNEIILYESVLLHSGPVYTPLLKAELRQK